MFVSIVVVVSVSIFGWADVFHLVDGTALGAALDRTVAGGLIRIEC